MHVFMFSLGNVRIVFINKKNRDESRVAFLIFSNNITGLVLSMPCRN